MGTVMADQRVALNGPAIREIRKGLGVRSEVLAEEVGISYSFLASLENGTRTSVSPDIFRKLVYALHLVDVRAIIANPYAAYQWVAAPLLASTTSVGA